MWRSACGQYQIGCGDQTESINRRDVEINMRPTLSGMGRFEACIKRNVARSTIIMTRKDYSEASTIRDEMISPYPVSLEDGKISQRSVPLQME
jgi:hypothetical protein